MRVVEIRGPKGSSQVRRIHVRVRGRESTRFSMVERSICLFRRPKVGVSVQSFVVLI